MTYGDLWSKVEKTETCWLWIASVQAAGYGQVNIGGKIRLAHRYIYELLVGPIPEGMQLDHLCRVRNCVNPDHLEPVTNRENTMRGAAPEVNRERMSSRTHCKNGHEFDYVVSTPNGGSKRICRTCKRESWARMQSKKKAENN